MITLKEYKDKVVGKIGNSQNLSSKNLDFLPPAKLNEVKLDFDVYLPTINKNLQRDLVWSLTRKRKLIESIFLGYDIPNVSLIAYKKNYTYKKDDVVYQVIDGKQRLTTLISFYNNGFSIEIDDKEYFLDDLPTDFKRKFLTFVITCQMISVYGKEDDFTDREKFHWHNQLNFGGVMQDEEVYNEMSKLFD